MEAIIPSRNYYPAHNKTERNVSRFDLLRTQLFATAQLLLQSLHYGENVSLLKKSNGNNSKTPTTETRKWYQVWKRPSTDRTSYTNQKKPKEKKPR